MADTGAETMQQPAVVEVDDDQVRENVPLYDDR
jgi:hypothetical protein